MTKLAHQIVSQTDQVVTMVSASASGDTFDNIPGTFVYIENGDAFIRTITIEPSESSISGNKSGGMLVADIDLDVPAFSGGVRGKLLFAVPSIYQNAKGVVEMTYSDESGLIVGVARVDQNQL